MKVRSVELIPFRGTTLIKLTADSGQLGWGECPQLLTRVQEQQLSQVQGCDPTAYEVMRTRLLAHPAQGAINMALLDLAGKAAKAPVYQLLGGATRNKVRAMVAVTGDPGKSPDKSIDALQRNGHRAFSISTGSAEGPRANFVAGVRDRLAAWKKAAGDGCDFVVDGSGALAPAEAQQVSNAVEKLHPLWLDEPCPLTNLAAARKLADENVTPLGWGRNIASLAAVQDLLREQMCDVVRLDIGTHGISSIRKAAALAETYYVAVAPYHVGGPIATAAAIQLAASLPNFFIQQVPQPPSDDWHKRRAEIAGTDIEKVTDGYLSIPTSPGLGIEVNESALRRYAQ